MNYFLRWWPNVRRYYNKYMKDVAIEAFFMLCYIGLLFGFTMGLGLSDVSLWQNIILSSLTLLFSIMMMGFYAVIGLQLIRIEKMRETAISFMRNSLFLFILSVIGFLGSFFTLFHITNMAVILCCVIIVRQIFFIIINAREIRRKYIN